MQHIIKGRSVVNRITPSLTRDLEFELENEKIICRDYFSLNEALCSANLDIIQLQCEQEVLLPKWILRGDEFRYSWV